MKQELTDKKKKKHMWLSTFVVVVCFPQKTCLHLAESRIYLTTCKEGGLPFV